VTYVGFSTPRRFNPVSWLVRLFTGSRTSHVWFLYFDQDFDLYMVMEAHELGFRVLPFSRFKKENRVVSVFKTQADLSTGMRWAATWLGTAYDFGGLIGMAWVLFWRMLRKNVRNPLRSSHAMFCSEITVKVLQRTATTWAKPLRAASTSPQDLLELFEKHEPPMQELP
jgi:hypothetical protein